MGVEDPGYLKVTCDECGEEGDFPTTEYAGDLPSWGIDEETLKANGWEYIEGTAICDKCAKAEELES